MEGLLCAGHSSHTVQRSQFGAIPSLLCELCLRSVCDNSSSLRSAPQTTESRVICRLFGACVCRSLGLVQRIQATS